MKREAKDEGKEERKGRRILNFAKGFNYEWRRDPAPWESKCKLLLLSKVQQLISLD